MAPNNPKKSRATAASINAYHPAYEAALNKRGIYLYRGKSEDCPPEICEIRDALYAANKNARFPEDQANLVREMLKKRIGEPEVVAKILPKFVPLTQIEKDSLVDYATDQFWRRCLAFGRDLKPSLKTPKPDLTIGWSSDLFLFKKASRSLRAFQCPIPSTIGISWPLFTAEVKGDGGSLRVARLQNLHNAAIMLSNLRELMKAASREAEFFDKIHVISLQLTPEVVQLSYYWATKSDDGQVTYYGDILDTWSPNSHKDVHLDEAYRFTYNAIELVRTRAYKSIHSCMADIENFYAQTPMHQIPSPRDITGYRVRKTSVRKARVQKTGVRKKSSSRALTAGRAISAKKASLLQ